MNVTVADRLKNLPHQPVSAYTYLVATGVGSAGIGLLEHFVNHRSGKDAALSSLLIAGCLGGSLFIARAMSKAVENQRLKHDAQQ